MRLLTGRDIKCASHVVQSVGKWGLGIVSIRVGVWTAGVIQMDVLNK